MLTPHLQSLDVAHVWHPFTPMREYAAETTPVIAAADGFELIDTDGRRYLDGTSALWCNLFGYRVPEIDAAIRDQIDRVSHSTLLGLANVPSVELAAELVRRVPRGLTRVFYSDDGSTAVEAALKIVYQYHQQRADRPGERSLFIRLSDAYHGDTLGAVSVGGISLFHGIYGQLLFQALQVPSPVTLRGPHDVSAEEYLASCYRVLEETISRHRDRIAGFIIEPLVQAAAGILVHPHGYLRKVRELTAAYDIPLIADEVAVGFGRTGTLFACEQEEVVPDVLCLSKGLTGGYLPLAATLVTDRIFGAFLDEPAAGKTFFHGHTYTGNPLACAAALATLEIFDERPILENVQLLANRLCERLAPLSDHPHVAEVRQKGVMVGIELVRDKPTLEPFPTSARIGHRIALAARERGAILRPLTDTLVLMPAPAMPVAFVDRLVDTLIESIDEVCPK